MRELPPPKPFVHEWRDGQFVEALRRPKNEPEWNTAHEFQRVEERLPSFAIGNVWTHCDTAERIFYYAVPFVLPIGGCGNGVRIDTRDFDEFDFEGWM